MDEELNTIEGTARADFLRGSWQDDFILAGAGNDLVFARSGDDVVDAGAGNDLVFAGSGDDLVKTGLGWDFADGGRGVDTAQFDGDSTDYKITSFFGLLFVTDLRSGETDTLTNFEFLQFDDGLFFPDGTPVATEPEAADDTASTDEDTPVNIDVLSNDSDPNNDQLTVTGAVADNGTVVIETDGTLTYTPPENFSGEARIDYTISDGNGGTSSATVTVMASGVADAPTLRVPVQLGTVDLAEIDLASVFAELTDKDGSELLSVKFSDLPQGSVISNPKAIELLEVQIIDQRVFNNDLKAEVRSKEGRRQESEDMLVDELGKPEADQDQDLIDQLVAEIADLAAQIDSGKEQIAENTASIADAIDRQSELTQVAGDDGTVSFDGLNSGFVLQLPDGTTEDFVLHVEATATESDPVASEAQRTATTSAEIDVIVRESLMPQDDTATTSEDTPVTIFALANDTGEQPQISEVGDAVHGTVIIDANGDLLYTPDLNFSGVDTFDYKVADTVGNTSTATVQVTVGGVADTPSLAVPDALRTVDLSDIDISSIVAGLADTDGSETLSLRFTGLPSGAVITNPTAIAQLEAQIGEQETRITALSDRVQANEVELAEKQDELVDVQNAGGPNQDRIDVLNAEIARLQDRIGLDNRQIAETTASVADARQSVTESTFTADKDGVIVAGELGDGFILQLPPDTVQDFELGVEAIAAEAGPVASEAVRKASVSSPIVVSVIESAIALDDTADTAEDNAVIINVADNDLGEFDAVVAVTDVTDPANGTVVNNGDGTVTYTPDPDFSGEDSFSYTIEDDISGTSPSTAAVTVRVGGVADRPAISVPETLRTVDLAEIDMSDVIVELVDQDGSERLTLKFTDLPKGSVVSNPDAIAPLALLIREKEELIGDLSGEVKTNRGRLQDKEVELFDELSKPDEEQDQDAIDVLRFEVKRLQQQIAKDNKNISDATKSVSDANQRLAELTREAGDDGMVSFDGLNSGFVLRLPPGATEDFVLGVEATATESDPVADETVRTASVSLPIAVSVIESAMAQDDSANTDEDNEVIIDVLANDVGDSGIAVTAVTDAANGSVVDNGNGTVTYTPDTDFNGLDLFTYTIEDDNGAFSIATVNVAVAPLNDDPQGAPLVAGTPEIGQTLTANPDPIIDPDGIGSLIYQWEYSFNDGDWEPVIGASASEYTPTGDIEGTILRVRVFYTDDGGTDETVVSDPTGPVTAANQDPVAFDDAALATSGLGVRVDVLDNDSDPDSDPLSVASVTQPTNGIATILPDGSVVYTSGFDFVGADSFTYDVSDGNGGTDTGTVRVTVSEQVIIPPGDGPPIIDDGGGGIFVPPPTVIVGSQGAEETQAAQLAPDGTLTGTADSDVFTFAQGDGNVDMVGFQQAGEAADQIELAGFGLSFSDLDSNTDGRIDASDTGVSGGNGGSDLTIDFGAADTLSIQNTTFLVDDDLMFV